MNFIKRAAALTFTALLAHLTASVAAAAQEVNGLKTAEAFESIESEEARSAALFEGWPRSSATRAA